MLVQVLIERRAVRQAGERIGNQPAAQLVELTLDPSALAVRGQCQAGARPVAVEARPSDARRQATSDPVHGEDALCLPVGASEHDVHDDALVSAALRQPRQLRRKARVIGDERVLALYRPVEELALHLQSGGRQGRFPSPEAQRGAFIQTVLEYAHRAGVEELPEVPGKIKCRC